MTSKTNIDWVVNDKVELLNMQASNVILQIIQNHAHPVIGFATGGTPLGLYQQLVQRSMASRELLARWRDVTGFNLDEYVGLTAEHPQSYHRYMWDHVYRYLAVPQERVYIPQGIGDLSENCSRYDDALAEHDWPDIQVLGIGQNGHIGFNEPASQLVLGTHVTQLSGTTRKANARFFKSIDAVPNQAITMGMGGILRAKQVILLAFGKEKRAALERAFSGVVTTDCPASFLQLHPKITVFTDQNVFDKATEEGHG